MSDRAKKVTSSSLGRPQLASHSRQGRVQQAHPGAQGQFLGRCRLAEAEALGQTPHHIVTRVPDGLPNLGMATHPVGPAMASNKEIDLRFVVGYGPLDFRDTLHMLAEGKFDARPLLTGTVGLDGVAAAFDALADPEAHAKIAIVPRSAAKTPARTV